MQEHRFTDHQAAIDFMLGGNAYLTLRSLKTQTRYTYRVKKARDRNLWFVSTLFGPSNTSEYAYVGTISEGTFRLTVKSRFNHDSPQAQAFAWAWAFLNAHQRVPTTLELWHEGRCGCCGRKLTVPESIEAGFGPECIKKAPEQSSRPGKIVY